MNNQRSSWDSETLNNIWTLKDLGIASFEFLYVQIENQHFELETRVACFLILAPLPWTMLEVNVWGLH